MVHTVDGGGAPRRNFHPADLNKDGKVGRQEAVEFKEAKVAQAQGPAKPAAPAKPQGDVIKTQYPTVGEAIENTLTDAKNEFFESAKIAGVMAIPGVNVAAGVVYARHMNEARREIAQLPMDPEGKWKDKARDIVNRHHEAAEDEILALPGKVAQGVVNAGEAVVEGVVDAGEAVVDGVVTAGEAVVDAGEAVVEGAVDAAEAVWGGVTGAAQSAWEFAKTEVPRAAKELATDAAVVAIMANPLGAAPSGIIIGNHIAQANKRIMDLPMDPEGKWKDQARAIIREEMAEAKHEILGLPGRAWEGVKDVSAAIYTGAQTALIATGEAIVDAGEAVVGGVVAAGEAVADAGEAVVDGVVHGVNTAVQAVDHAVDSTVEAVTNKFEQARRGLGGAISRFGRWISGD